MDIIERLKKKKKSDSVFDALIKRKKEKNSEKDEKVEQPRDIEIRELPDTARAPTPEQSEEIMDITQLEAKPVREFRTEGMHEFDIESLGTSSDAALKAEYKSRINNLVDHNDIDGAIALLQELKKKLSENR